MSTLFLICFLVGLGVSAVSLFASFLHLHHGGVHFHFHHGAASSLLKNASDFFGSLFNLAAITMFLAWFGGVGLLLEQMTHLVGALIVAIAGGRGITGEIGYPVAGKRRCTGARTEDRRAIPRDTEVVITRYDKGIAYVCEFDRMIAR